MSARKGELAKLAPKPEVAIWRPETIGDLLVKYCRTPAGKPFAKPYWLAPIEARLHQAVFEGGVSFCAHAPPQHTKSSLLCAALVFHAIVKPGYSHLFVAYNLERALAARHFTEQLASAAGLDPQGAGEMMRLRGGTTIRFTGINAGITGHSISGLALCDDLIASESEARSPTVRDSVWNELGSSVFTRAAPGANTSFVVSMTRWHPDDPIGRLINEGWEYVRLAAICDSEDDPLGRAVGDVLWPEGQPLQVLSRHRQNKRKWLAMYQGVPSTCEIEIFGAPNYYDGNPPASACKVAFGLDLARSAKAGSDFSCLLAGRTDGTTLWLTHCLRMQIRSEVFRNRVQSAVNRLGPGRPIGFHAGPGEALFVAAYRELGLNVRTYPTQNRNKAIRAEERAAPLWNAGRVLVPREADWAPDFVREVSNFSGRDGIKDDSVDALTSLVTALGLREAAPAADMTPATLASELRGVGRGWTAAPWQSPFISSRERGGSRRDREPGQLHWFADND